MKNGTQCPTQQPECFKTHKYASVPCSRSTGGYYELLLLFIYVFAVVSVIAALANMDLACMTWPEPTTQEMICSNHLEGYEYIHAYVHMYIEICVRALLYI